MAISGRTWSSLVNYGLFQAGWFVLVLGAAAGHPGPATAAGLLLVAIHLALVREPGREALLLLAALVLGILVDGIHIRSGVLVFPVGSVHPALPPPWILALWLQFAMSLHYSLGWLRGRHVLGMALGGVSGALAYWAGVRFGAAEFGADLPRSLVQIGLSWAPAMAVLLWVAERTQSDQQTGCYRWLGE